MSTPGGLLGPHGAHGALGALGALGAAGGGLLGAAGGGGAAAEPTAQWPGAADARGPRECLESPAGGKGRERMGEKMGVNEVFWSSNSYVTRFYGLIQ